MVVGLARGGAEVAAEVARELGLPLDLVAVRKVGHPWQPEYAIGAVAPGDGVYLRDSGVLSKAEVSLAVEMTKSKAAALDRRLHAEHPALDLAGRTCLLVDDGLATGATMIAAIRWARGRKAARVIAAAPVAAVESAALVRGEADAFVCPKELEEFVAVGLWYRDFEQAEDEAVVKLLEEAERRVNQAHASA